MKHHYNARIMRALHARHPELSTTQETALPLSQSESLTVESIETIAGDWFPQAFALLQEGDALEAFQQVGSKEQTDRDNFRDKIGRLPKEQRDLFNRLRDLAGP